MDEISKQKLDIAYLQRDKQSLLNQITDLNVVLLDWFTDYLFLSLALDISLSVEDGIDRAGKREAAEGNAYAEGRWIR